MMDDKLEKIISKLNILKGYLKTVNAADPDYFYTPEFTESMAEARSELDICIKELTDAWIKEE
jgi:hypothetical protein